MHEICEHPLTSAPGERRAEDPLTDQELAVLQALRAAPHRVLSRGELARAAGLTSAQGRRVDVLLVHIRKSLTHEAIINVRNRGWRLLPAEHADVHESEHGFATVRESA